MHSLRSDFAMKNRHGISGYQAQRAFHLPLQRGRFGNQEIRAFGSEELKCRGARSCHQAVRLVNLKL
jgi:hypothetical protein